MVQQLIKKTKFQWPDDDDIYPESDGKPMSESDQTRDYLIYAVEALRIYFQEQTDVYVSGNLFIYFEKGNPKSVVSPDVFVIFGVENKQRRSYKIWENNHKLPDFVIEMTSKSTVTEDQGIKKGLYAFLGVKEYFQYDPTADYLNPPLQGLRLINGNYQPIEKEFLDEGNFTLNSDVLGLKLQLIDGNLRFLNPITKQIIASRSEVETILKQQKLARIEAENAQKAEQLARIEAENAQKAEQLARIEAEKKVSQLEEKLKQLGFNLEDLC